MSDDVKTDLRVRFESAPSCYCMSSFDGEGDGVCPVHKSAGAGGVVAEEWG